MAASDFSATIARSECSWSGVVEGNPGNQRFSVFIQHRGDGPAALQRLAGEHREDLAGHPNIRILQVEGDMLFAAGPDDHSFRSGTLWPNGQVTWCILPGFSPARSLVIRNAVDYLASETTGHLTFVEIEPNNAELRFRWHASDTSSFVGYMGPNMPWQPINVADWAPMGSVVHELLHALGLWHEHTRADRDEFVTIDWSNIVVSARGNFEKRLNWDDLFTYDYDSIMHYGRFGFAIDGSRPTIIPKDPRARIGQREHLSPLDRRTLQTLYAARPVAAAFVAGAEPGAPIWREARSLAELRAIREQNRAVIERVNGNLGSALGFKYSNGIQTQHPAVLVFVPVKLVTSELAVGDQIPTWLGAEVDNERIWAHTDVIQGGKAPNYTPPTTPLTPENLALTRRLRDGSLPLQGGVALFGVARGFDGFYTVYRGTIAAVVRRGDQYFVLTNQHVAGNVGNVLYRTAGDATTAARSLNQGGPFPPQVPAPIGRTVFAREYVDRNEWIGGGPVDGIIRCDFALVELQHTVNFDPERDTMNGINSFTNEEGQPTPIQDPVQINDMAPGLSPIGSFVQRVGTTRGKQSGVIAAVDYEYQDLTDQADQFTDFLVVSDYSSGVFSDRGDSGSLIVATDCNPLALLWGGQDERLRRDRGQEKWTYAVSIPRIFSFLRDNGYPGLHF